MQRCELKLRILLGVSVIAAGIALASAAQAQTAASKASAVAEQDQDHTSTDIVVTANKRSESIRTVAGGISVVTGDSLVTQKREQLADYVANMPGVSANTLGSPGQSSLTIRGIPPLTTGSKVATYIDEAPLGSSGIWAAQSVFQLDLMPFDLDRLELLRGPQGTLYGAGSMGGLLKYVFRTPNTHRLEFDGGIDLSSIAGASAVGESAQGRVSIPIKENVAAFSLSGFYSYAPGFIGNAYDGRRDVNSNRRYGGRAALVLTPTDTLTIKLNAMTQRTRSRDDATISLLDPEQIPQPDGSILVKGGMSTGGHSEDKAFLAPFRSDVDFYSATVNWNRGALNFVSATSWSNNHIVHVADNSISYGSYLPLFGLPAGLVKGRLELGLHKFTQEFRVATPADKPISALLGVFYTSEHARDDQFVSAYDTDYQPIAALDPYAGFTTIPTVYREYAVFGDIVWKPAPRIELSGGMRYSLNRQRYDITASGALLGLPQSPATVLPMVRSRDANTTFMASAKYRFANSSIVYARFSTGYAPGGANTPLPGAPPSVDAETLNSYEGGIKSQFLNGHLRLDLSGYHLEWSDIQLPAVTNNVGYTENGGRAVSNGFEFSGVVSPIRNLNIDLSAAYTDARLKSVKADVATPFVLDSQLLMVPKWTWAISPTYGWAIGSWSANIGGTVRWTDKQYGVEKIVGQPYFVLPRATLIDLNASLSHGPLTLRAFVRNLTNRLAPTTGFLNTDLTGNTVQTDLAITQPRTIGAGAIMRF